MFLAFAVLSIAVFSACAKKKGCMDKDSTNFDSSAQQDDGSCQYKGSIVLWMDTANQLGPGYSEKIYLDGVFQGNINVYFAKAPGCGATGALTISRNLGTNKNQGHTLRMDIDSSGFPTTPPITATTAVNFTGNTCISYKMN